MSSIYPLPPDVVSKIKSSITITSLNAVILELLKNSLDASSSRVDVSVDYGRGSCTLTDDGLGISPADFEQEGGLGKLYHSSKYSNTSVTYGVYGSFLASLAALSLLSITSHHHLYHSQNSITINRSEVIARQIPAPPQQHIIGVNHGTRAVVRDLFGNMPVRVKQRAAVAGAQPGSGKDWEDLRRGVTSLLLAWPYSLTVNVKDVTSGQNVQLRTGSKQNFRQAPRSHAELPAHICSVLTQANYIQIQQKSSWVSATASTESLSIQGVISLEPAPTKNIQFISLGFCPIERRYGNNVLYKDINKVFSNSSFGIEGSAVKLDDGERQRRVKDRRYKSDGFTNQELKGQSKGVDRWPMFYIKVDIVDILPVQHTLDTLLDEKEGIMGAVSELLQLMLVQFLRDHHFNPRFTRVGFSNMQGMESADTLYMNGDNVTRNSADRITTGHTRVSSKPAYVPLSIQSSLRPCTSQRNSILRVESPFNSWSRIKSGRQIPSPSLLSTPVRPGKDAKSNLGGTVASSNRPTVSSSRLSVSKAADISRTAFGKRERSKKSSQYQSPVDSRIHSKVSKSGEIFRRPFEDLPPSRCAESFPAVESSTLSNIASRYTVTERKTWVDPISGEEFLVDTRTGLATHQPSALQRGSSILSTVKPRLPKISKDGKSGQEPSPWIKSLLDCWNNPVFKPAQEPILRVSTEGLNLDSQQLLHGHRHKCSHQDIDRGFSDSSACFAGRLSKDSLRNAKFVSQVDNKFILIKTCGTSTPDFGAGNYSGEMLILIDQHAADERCRVEDLLSNFWTSSGVLSTLLEKPMSFDISQREIKLLKMNVQYFADWGIIYSLPALLHSKHRPLEQKITVTALPSGIIERCKLEPKLVIGLIRSEAWQREDGNPTRKFTEKPSSDAETDRKEEFRTHQWLRKTHNFPQGILNILVSRACRSAVMFNDQLSQAQCKDLVTRLAECAFPFQCAHGRPSMVPLVDVGTLWQGMSPTEVESGINFAASFKMWKSQLARVAA